MSNVKTAAQDGRKSEEDQDPTTQFPPHSCGVFKPLIAQYFGFQTHKYLTLGKYTPIPSGGGGEQQRVKKRRKNLEHVFVGWLKRQLLMNPNFSPRQLDV